MKTIDYSFFIERYNAGEMNDAEKVGLLRNLTAAGSYRKKWL